MLARSNGRIDNYNCSRKPGLRCFLRQNPNLTLLGSYHKAESYQRANKRNVFGFNYVLSLNRHGLVSSQTQCS